MVNCIGFMGFLELWCQCIKWHGVFLASWSQVGTWPSLVHPWRLQSLNPWWWYRDFRGNNYWTWWGHVDLVLKFVGYFPSSYTVTFGCTEGRGLVRSGCTFWGTMADFFTVCCCGGSAIFFTLSDALENILESCSIANIWESPMLENGAWGAGFFKA